MKSKSTFKSYRSNATATLFKGKTILLTSTFSKAGMHISDVQAGISSSKKTSKAALKAVVKQIIVDLYRVTEP